MPEIVRLSGASDWIELDLVERERTPSRLMKLGIRLHLAGLSLSNTIRELETFGVQRSLKAVHTWVQKADLQPSSGESPNQVALDETTIRIDGQQYWLYVAVDAESKQILHARLFSTTTKALTESFLGELQQKHDVNNAQFLIDNADHLKMPLQRAGLRFRVQRHGNRNAIERLFRETKRRTSSFSNTFSHVHSGTAETWLLAHAKWLNSLN